MYSVMGNSKFSLYKSILNNLSFFLLLDKELSTFVIMYFIPISYHEFRNTLRD